MPGEILAYEQSSRPRRWRCFVTRWTRRLVLPALVIGILAGGWWWREWIVDWAGWLGFERRGARQQFMMERMGQLRMAVLHMARLDAEDEGRLLVPFSIYGNNTYERTSAGTLELRLGDDDVLRARIVEMSPADEQVACVDWVAMPQANGPPHALAPWQTLGAQQMERAQVLVPSQAMEW